MLILPPEITFLRAMETMETMEGNIYPYAWLPSFHDPIKREGHLYLCTHLPKGVTPPPRKWVLLFYLRQSVC